MNESKIFLFESFNNHKFFYEVHDDGLIYRPDSNKNLRLRWHDIQYIEDCSGDRVDLFLNNKKEIPIRYVTNEFPVLLKTICLKLSEIRKESFYPYKFTITLKYWLHFYFVVSALVLSLVGSFFVGNALFLLLLTLFLPLGIFIQRLPISLTLGGHSLTVRNLLFKRTFNYDEIKNVDFEVESNDYGSTLCVLINLKNRKKLTIKKIENIILFFIMLQVKLNEDVKNTD